MTDTAGSRPGEQESAAETLRQRLVRHLRAGEHSFLELQEALGLRVRELEAELRHVERSARREGLQLLVVEPRCIGCGFAFSGRHPRHLHPPGRCPECRCQRIAPPRFALRASGQRGG